MEKVWATRRGNATTYTSSRKAIRCSDPRPCWDAWRAHGSPMRREEAPRGLPALPLLPARCDAPWPHHPPRGTAIACHRTIERQARSDHPPKDSPQSCQHGEDARLRPVSTSADSTSASWPKSNWPKSNRWCVLFFFFFLFCFSFFLLLLLHSSFSSCSSSSFCSSSFCFCPKTFALNYETQQL